MIINYDTSYEALQRANEIADKKLEVFHRAMISLQQETALQQKTKKIENNQSDSSNGNEVVL